MPYPVHSKFRQDGNINFLMVSKYQIFDYLVTKTDLITHYFRPIYGPPYAFLALNKNPTVPIDNKKLTFTITVIGVLQIPVL